MKGIAACLIGATVCITVGCAASPSVDHNSADGESEKHEESASEKLPEANGKDRIHAKTIYHNTPICRDLIITKGKSFCIFYLV